MASASASSSAWAPGEVETCAICLDLLDDPLNQQQIACRHIFHKSCIHAMQAHGCEARCPLCKKYDNDLSGFNLFEEAVRLYVLAQRKRAEERRSLLEKAASLFREFLQVDTQHVEALCNLALSLRLLGNINGAMEQFRAALCVRPNHPDSLINLGDCLKKCGDLSGAIEHYAKASGVLFRDPRQVQVRYKIGECLFKVREVAEAIPNFLQVLELNPQHVPSHCYLGMAYKQQGDMDTAMQHFTKAKELNPRDPDARFCLGNTLLEQGRIDEAMVEYSAALAYDPHHERAKDNLTWCERQKILRLEAQGSAQNAAHQESSSA